jgi:hypothetical protein
MGVGMTSYYEMRIDWGFIRGQEGDWSVGYVPNVKNRRGVVKSGTTILFGFDLGQHDLAELESLHLSTRLAAKLSPYLGKKGTDAVMAPQRSLEGALDKLIALNNAQTGTRTGSVGTMSSVGVVNRPDAPAKPGQTPRQFVAPDGTVLRLELSSDERAELTQAIQQHFYRQLQTHYDAHRRGRKFSALPVGVQTALLSLSWQTGNIWGHNHPAHAVFRAALQENWSAVAAKLSDGSLVGGAINADAARRRAEANLIRTSTVDPRASAPSTRQAVRPAGSPSVPTLGSTVLP